ncbi:WD repeat-containing protein 90-like isoform X2 [Ptychodera flava]|uniref:WD repeat-containing protein 90-like isoform X2 n=1 Tax=Ptychodera flava TaxID=63121 RepID=UPI00396A0A28
MSKSLWQHPYVNVFKHLNVGEWKKSAKEGEVMTVMDKQLKCTVYRITGSIPAGNYIQLPKTSTQSLGLTGRYFYLMFKPLPGKYFVVHLDVATQDGLIVRISFSNLFKEFKSTSTWLQFPYVCNPSKGSVEGYTVLTTRQDHQGPAPQVVRWTLLMLDFQYILSMYLNRKYSYLKNVRLCANIMVKNVFTSDMQYEPGLSLKTAKRTGMLSEGVSPVPREMAFPVPKHHDWYDFYDHIRFPSDATKVPFDSIQIGRATSPTLSRSPLGTMAAQRVSPTQVNVSRAVSDRVSLINKLTSPKKPRRKTKVTKDLPEVNVIADGPTVVKGGEGEVHVFAHPEDDVTVHRHHNETGLVHTTKVTGNTAIPRHERDYKTLKPDPILSLRRIIGFGGSTSREALWSHNGTTVVYPCHAVIVAMNAFNGHQRFFLGHTDKVSAIAFNGSTSLLASAQTGKLSVVRVWKFDTGECLAMFKTHVHSVYCLSFSHSGGVLCGVGKDSHNKNMVVVWNTTRVNRSGEVSVMAKAHTDVDIVRMKIASFDDTRMVSCGHDNVRLWRVRNGSLRSAPVNLGEYHTADFTDICFDAAYQPTGNPVDRTIYACTKSGHIFEIDYSRVSIVHVRRLLPIDKNKKEKDTFHAGVGIAINCMSVNQSFCVTGSEDGYLRLWPLDFSNVFLEAEHEGPVTAVDITIDGLQILAGTQTGNIGVLDISTRQYTTVMRSHTDSIASVSVDPLRRHVATVSMDHTIRIWDLDNLQQLFDFSAPRECPCALTYHPSLQVFACGFDNGCVRVFNVATTSLLAEHRQHRAKVTGLMYSPNGNYLYSCGALGSIALYDAESGYQLIRLLGNTVAKGENYGPDAIAVSDDGHHIAFVGPTEFTVSIVDARSLDEVVRVDITSMNSEMDSKVLDRAVKVWYAPKKTRQLLVVTASSRLLKLDATTGRLLSEVSNIHRAGCTSIDVSPDGKHLATAGDKVVKIWDYHMRLDLNFQVFIGHSENVQKLCFTPDSLSLISIGEAMFVWDFYGTGREQEPIMEGRTTGQNYITGIEDDARQSFFKSPKRHSLEMSNLSPRGHIPQPAEPVIINGVDETNGSVQDESQEDVAVLIGPELDDKDEGDLLASETDDVDGEPAETLGTSSRVKQHRQLRSPEKVLAPADERASGKDGSNHKPYVMKHFKQRVKQSQMAQRRYTASPSQAGLKLKSVIGYNGNGRNNVVWHPDSGLFAYSSGCVIIIEDLHAGTQKHLLGHIEEISTMALQHDAQVLASASGAHGLTASQICLWDVAAGICKKVLSYHEYDMVCLAYSRDDRFLVSVGDYRECSIVVWNTNDYSVIAASKTALPVHELRWDPYSPNEFVSVGARGTVLFWLLDETHQQCSLNVHEADVPEELMDTNVKALSDTEFTSVAYGGDNVLYVGSNTGVLSAWDTRHNTCFMHWDADSAEITSICCKFGSSHLITGSASRNLRLWSVYGISEMRLNPSNMFNSTPGKGLVMEDEMTLDGGITGAGFDDTMDMGIVGTTAGTLWYINWIERTSIRLVSSHMNMVNDIVFNDSEQYFASCADDGSLKVWSMNDMEQKLQFQVADQACTCLAFSPDGTATSDRPAEVSQSTDLDVASTSPQKVAAGYSDGTVRVFDLKKVDMILKMHSHSVAVTNLAFSPDGAVILSGSSDGLIAVSSPTTGMTIRVISDHKGAPITDMHVTSKHEMSDSGLPATTLWLAASADRRVSVWVADWSKDSCELMDWLTFPAPAFTPDGTAIRKGDISSYRLLPPSLARFSPSEPDIIVYAGYGMQKQIQFYSLSQRKVVRTAALTHWATDLSISPSGHVIATGASERLVKLIDYYEGSFQDFTGHNDSVHLVAFSPSGRFLLTAGFNEIIIWELAV